MDAPRLIFAHCRSSDGRITGYSVGVSATRNGLPFSHTFFLPATATGRQWRAFLRGEHELDCGHGGAVAYYVTPTPERVTPAPEQACESISASILLKDANCTVMVDPADNKWLDIPLEVERLERLRELPLHW